MTENKQPTGIETIAKGLRQNVKLTELSLINFCDELRRNIAKDPSKTKDDIAQIFYYLIEIQNDYTTLKGKVLSFLDGAGY